MARLTSRRGPIPRPCFASRGRLFLTLAASCLVVAVGASGQAGDPEPAAGPRYYSTADPPRDYAGPAPGLLAMAEAPAPAVATEKEPIAPPERAPVERAPAAPPPSETAEPPARPKVATTPAREPVPRLATAAPSHTRPAPTAPSRPTAAPDPHAEAKKAIADCRASLHQVRDYTCTFFKRERVGGRLTGQHVMLMKFRNQPMSVYFKFVRPNAGREAIYVAGRNGGRAWVHDVGIGKLIAGTLSLDPRSERAMEDCRHPITDAGLGHLIDSLADAWGRDLRPELSRVEIHRNAKVGNRPCTMIETTFPRRQPGLLFYMVKVYIDHEHNLPIRFEAYDWPRRPGLPADLMEEYTYVNLRTNVGLSEHDFDPGNERYAFGRF
jgi:hypothetical protein